MIQTTNMPIANYKPSWGVRFGLAALVASTSVLWATTNRGPDAGSYTATDGAVYSFADLTSGGGSAAVLAGTDDGVALLTLPFSFKYYGSAYNLVCASSNGILSFVTTASACTQMNDFANTDLTSTAPPADLPAALPYWTDLTFQVPGSGAVYYQTLGTPGSRRFVVEWYNAYPQGSANPVTFEVVLSEGTNLILFQYQTVDVGQGNPASNGALSTIGIRDAGGNTNNRQIAWSYDAAVAANSAAILFTPGSGLQTPTITWPKPSDLAFGTALGRRQLNATANVPGTFAYTPPAGTVLPVGNGQTLFVTFTPTDTTHYAAVSASTSINVLARNVPGVKIIVTQVLSRDSKGNVFVTLTLANAGSTAATSLAITAARIDTVSGVPLPQTVGVIASDAIAVTTLTFPASVGEPNDDATLTVIGSYVGGTFNSRSEVTIPAFPGGGQ